MHSETHHERSSAAEEQDPHDEHGGDQADMERNVGDQRKSRVGINESRGAGWGAPPGGEVSGGSPRWGRLRRW